MAGRIIVITDGIAAAIYTPQLINALRGRGYTVKLAPTGYSGASALEFMSDFGWAALSGHPTLDLSSLDAATLSWAEAVILAPVSSRVLSIFSTGKALQLLQDAGRPVLIVPAQMPSEDVDIPAGLLEALPAGSMLLPPQDGELVDLGAMGKIAITPCATVIELVRRALSRKRLQGKKVLITCGPTIEDIDPVRYITNRSSGRMGVSLAMAALAEGAQVTLVHGPISITLPRLPGLTPLPVRSAAQMHQAVSQCWSSCDLAILAAAVADFTPDHYAESKIKKTGSGLALNLVRTQDILAELGSHEHRPFLVGFAAESDDVEINALTKLRRKHCDMICANDIRAPGCGFAVETNRVSIYRSEGTPVHLPMLSKDETAVRIIAEIAAAMG